MNGGAEAFVWLSDPSEAPPWMAGIIWKKGTTQREGEKPVDHFFPASCSANAATILACDPRWEGVIAYDEFAEQVSLRSRPPWHVDDVPAELELGPWREEDTTRAAFWLQRAYRITLGENTVHSVVAAVARRRPFHPVRDWLRALRWDAQQRLPSLLHEYFGAEDTPYSRFGSVSLMVSAVARAFDPGCKVDTVLILEGTQGIGKSSALRALVPGDWFLEFNGGVDGKDAMQQLRAKWIVELPELDALSKSEASRAKAFFSAQVDTYRQSYGRSTRDYPRQCVCIGTVNKNRYFHDETGNRRYLPVACSRADRRGLEVVRDQLWAEAVARYDSAELWHVEDPELLDACREQQEARYVADVWEPLIADWLAKPSDIGSRAVSGVTTGDVLAALKIDPARMGRVEEMRAALCLRRLGWEVGKQSRRSGAVVRLYRPAQPSQPGQNGSDEGCDDPILMQFLHDTMVSQPSQPDLRIYEEELD